MRVAIEAASLTLTSGGLARYTAELSLALARSFPDDEYVLFSDQPFRMPLHRPANLTRGGGPRNALENRWWLWGASREAGRLGAELVHGPDFSVPYLPMLPSVLTLHDLSPWMNPDWHSTAGRVAARTPYLLRLGLATMVVTPSQSVRKQAIERFGLRPERVVAIPEAAAPWFRPVEATPTPAPYFLFVGTAEPRKNIEEIVGAWRALRRERNADLVIVGRRRADGPRIEPEPGLRILGELPDDELPALYSGAVAFLYPSRYEGFGLPVLEAMQCGACVIASGALTETASDAAAYAGSPGEWTRLMARALDDDAWRSEMRARSLMRAARFSWEAAARETREVYKEACGRFGL